MTCDHTAVIADDGRWYAMRFVATEYVRGIDLEVRECPRCHCEVSRPLPAVEFTGRYGIGAPRGPQLSPRTHRPFEARSRSATVKLPADWKPVSVPVPSTGPQRPAPSKAMRADGLAVTDVLPVVGRAGSKEWARNAAPCFGGGEVR